MTSEQITTIADDYYKQFESKHFEGKSENDYGFDRIIIKADAKDHDKLVNLTFVVVQETSLSMDSVYLFTQQVLGIIADKAGETKDDIEQAGYDIEADTYTSDLTSWLNESNTHVDYITQVLEEYNLKSGFDVLAQAQLLAKSEVYRVVLEEIQKSV